MLKMHQNRLAAGSARTRWRSFSDPLVAIWGLLLRGGRTGEGRGGKEGGEGKGRREGRGPQPHFLATPLFWQIVFLSVFCAACLFYSVRFVILINTDSTPARFFRLVSIRRPLDSARVLDYTGATCTCQFLIHTLYKINILLDWQQFLRPVIVWIWLACSARQLYITAVPDLGGPGGHGPGPHQ